MASEKILWIIDSDVEFEGHEEDTACMDECSKCKERQPVRKVRGFNVLLCQKCMFKEVGCNGCRGRLLQFFKNSENSENSENSDEDADTEDE